MIRTASAFALAFALAACGGSSEADNTAAALEDAASQSTPEGAAVLENAADQIREQNVTAPIAEPGSPGQQALQAAGNAQANAKSAPAPQPSQGAKPHAPGDPVPPPKVKAGAAGADAETNHSGH
ncbi:MAG TPA: hypothetical protein VGB48_08020 [Allosphingosinicella sp.]|jgi:hypothetical protein